MLPLPPGKLRWIAILQRVELDQLEQLPHAPQYLRFRRAQLLRTHAQPEGDVLHHRHVAKQGIVLEHETHLPPPHRFPRHVLAVKEDRAVLSRVKRLQAGDDPQKRRLPRSRRPQQGHELAVRNLQRYVRQRREPPETLADVANFNAHGLSPPSDTSCFVRHSTSDLSTNVTTASTANTEATAKAATKLYSL